MIFVEENTKENWPLHRLRRDDLTEIPLLKDQGFKNEPWYVTIISDDETDKRQEMLLIYVEGLAATKFNNNVHYNMFYLIYI
jgi:hypothetical protein